jgi:hypothetical protein
MWALLCRTPMTLFSMDGPQGGSGFPRRAVKALQGWSYPACHALYLSLVLHFLSVSTKLLLFGIRLVVCQILETRSVPDFGDLFLIVGYLCGPHWLGIPNANIQSLKYYRIWIFWSTADLGFVQQGCPTIQFYTPNPRAQGFSSVSPSLPLFYS